MTRLTTALLALLLVVSVVSAQPAATAEPAQPTPEATAPAVPDPEAVTTNPLDLMVAVVIAVAVVLSSLLGYSVYQLANSVPGKVTLTVLANNRQRIPTTIDDTVLEVGLKLGKLRLNQRPDGQYEVVPVETPDDTINRRLDQIAPKES
jgi:hypothetical protein